MRRRLLPLPPPGGLPRGTRIIKKQHIQPRAVIRRGAVWFRRPFVNGPNGAGQAFRHRADALIGPTVCGIVRFSAGLSAWLPLRGSCHGASHGSDVTERGPLRRSATPPPFAASGWGRQENRAVKFGIHPDFTALSCYTVIMSRTLPGIRSSCRCPRRAR